MANKHQKADNLGDFKRYFPTANRFFYDVIFLNGTPFGTMPTDREGYALTHEQADQLIDNIQRFYSHITPNEIEQMNQPIPQPECAKQPKPTPKSKPGCVYVILAEKTGLYKIGHTDNPDRRLKQLQRNSPDILDYVVTISTDDALTKEKHLHAMYTDKRVNGEWFKLTPEDVQSIWENR